MGLLGLVLERVLGGDVGEVADDADADDDAQTTRGQPREQLALLDDLCVVADAKRRNANGWEGVQKEAKYRKRSKIKRNVRKKLYKSTIIS